VFDVKLIAVLNARSDDTAGMSVGFNGSSPCRRWIAYNASHEHRLNATKDSAYVVHRCSRDASIPQRR